MTKKIYFASDFHLGTPSYQASRQREATLVAWMDSIQPTCGELYLMGDIFDFWFEYKYVIPKGFVRLQGKIAEFTDAGIPVYFFKGNHDMWVRDYFTKELGMQIVSDELIIDRMGKRFYLHHGDGLGPGDKKYKLLRKVFRNPVCQWLFGVFPPAWGMGIATRWSEHSRAAQPNVEQFYGAEKEWLAIYAKEILAQQPIDYFVFGHRHLPMEIKLNDQSTYVNIGEWLSFNSYGVFDGETLSLAYYK